MDQLSGWLQSYGPFGLFLAAALDSFVPLGHVVDPMVVYLSSTSRRPVLYASLATAGSLLGTVVLYLLVRAGGEAFASRGLRGDRRRRAQDLLRRHGVLAVVIGGMLPPPFPFKAVVLASGLARMRASSFAAGVLVARALRYGLESALALFLTGPGALTFMKEHYAAIGLGFVLLLVAISLLTQRLLGAAAPAAGPAEPA